MGHEQHQSTLVYEDNQAVILSLKAGFIATKHRHIDVASQVCRERRDDYEVYFVWTPSALNLSDALTKNTAATGLETTRTKLHGEVHIDHPPIHPM